jgi:DNA-binding transcriptional ArsR family regulator
MSKQHAQIDAAKLDVSSEILRALAHPLRLQIIEFIDTNKSVNVNKIYNTLKLEQSITSQHLRILRTAGLVTTRREGKFILYEVNYNYIDNSVRAVDTFLTNNPVEIDDMELMAD